MKIVIDIREDIKALIDEYGTSEYVCDILWQSIKNGVPLPKEYGRLIIVSKDRLKENQINLDFSCQKMISEVGLSNATVATIEADKEQE